MDKKLQTIKTYNQAAEALAKKFDEIGARVKDIELAFSYTKNSQPNVFEIGCANGRDAKEILKKTQNYVGIDISKSLINIAKTNIPQATFEIADVEDYTFPKNLDIIFAFASLLHSPKEQLAKILSQAYQSLNPEGIFYISLKYGEYHELTNTEAIGTRTYYFYNPEIIKEIAGNKYKVIDIDTQNLRGEKWFTIILQK